MKGPQCFVTARLILRKPEPADAVAIFSRYSGDPEVTKYLGWPMHRRIEDTRAFLAFSNEDWRRWPAGPYLIESRADGRLLGGTGLGFDSRETASTGYVLARDAWGVGYATEALGAMVELAASLRVTRLYSFCHPDHRASIRVLEKCGFVREPATCRIVFPNLAPGEHLPCLRFARIFESATSTPG